MKKTIAMIAILTILNTQNMLFGKLLTIKSDIEIVGAGITETTIQLWGYIGFAIVIILAMLIILSLVVIVLVLK